MVISQSRLVTDQNRPITMDLCHLSLTANNMMAKLTSKVTQTRLSTFKWPQPFTWLWGWLLHRLSRLVTDQNRSITMDLCHLSLTANNMMAKLTSKVTQTRLSTFKWPQPFTWLWWRLLHRLSWHQSPLATTVLLSTTLSHFLYSGNLNVWFKSNIVRRNKILVTDNPFTPASDQDRISPYNINTILIR